MKYMRMVFDVHSAKQLASQEQNPAPLSNACQYTWLATTTATRLDPIENLFYGPITHGSR